MSIVNLSNVKKKITVIQKNIRNLSKFMKIIKLYTHIWKNVIIISSITEFLTKTEKISTCPKLVTLILVIKTGIIVEHLFNSLRIEDWILADLELVSFVFILALDIMIHFFFNKQKNLRLFYLVKFYIYH